MSDLSYDLPGKLVWIDTIYIQVTALVSTGVGHMHSLHNRTFASMPARFGSSPVVSPAIDGPNGRSLFVLRIYRLTRYVGGPSVHPRWKFHGFSTVIDKRHRDVHTMAGLEPLWVSRSLSRYSCLGDLRL